MQPYTNINVVLREIARATRDITDSVERGQIANKLMDWYEITDEDWKIFLKQISIRVFRGKNGDASRPSRNYFSYRDIRSESHDFEKGSEFNPFLKVSTLKKAKTRKINKKIFNKPETEQRPEKPFVAHDSERLLEVPEVKYLPDPWEIIKPTDEWAKQKNIPWAEALKQVLDNRKIFGKHRIILIYRIELSLRYRRKLKAEKAKKYERFKVKMTSPLSFTEKIQETYKRPLEKDWVDKDDDDPEPLPF